jgi:hypothetical protein
MDAAALQFIEAVDLNPWNAMDFDLPLPDGLDLAALQWVRPVVYALLQPHPPLDLCPLFGQSVDRRAPGAEARLIPRLVPTFWG